MPYTVRIELAAQRVLDRLAERDRERISRALEGLKSDPRPKGVKKLRSRAPAWRIRVGAYRIIYVIFDPDLIVIIVAVDRRSEDTYQDLNTLLH